MRSERFWLLILIYLPKKFREPEPEPVVAELNAEVDDDHDDGYPIHCIIKIRDVA